MIEVPAVVRSKATVAGATRWLRDLAEIVGAIASEWGLTIGRPFADATEAFVVEVTLDDGTPAVLKVVVPRGGDAAKHEITVLRLADGEGCVRLLRVDEANGALLLERLGSSLHNFGLPLNQRLEILTAAAAKVWRPAADAGLPTGAAKGRWLVEFIAAKWEQLDRPCTERAVELALACADRRIAAHDDARAVLVHGDVHEWNALQAGSDFKLVDPDGLLAEAEYDLGVLMREDPVELLTGDPRERARRLAALSGLDAEVIWEWGVVERVSTGLLCTEIDLQPIGHQMLRTADHVAMG
ncbi:MAG: aminoglycoside phosphotransferase family protein [Acidimicrobiales bacterium]